MLKIGGLEKIKISKISEAQESRFSMAIVFQKWESVAIFIF